MFFLDIVDFYLVLFASLGIVGGKSCGLLEGAVWHLGSFCLQDHMGTGNLFGVEPPVVPVGEFEGKLVVLEVVFPHIDMKTVAAHIVEGLTGDFYFFGAALSADIAALDQLLTDLHQIFLLHGDVQSGKDGFQMFDLFTDLNGQFRQRFIGSFELSVFIKIFLCVFLRRQGVVQRNRDGLVGIIIERLHGFGLRLHVVAVGVDQFAVNLVLVPLFRILHLPHL